MDGSPNFEKLIAYLVGTETRVCLTAGYGGMFRCWGLHFRDPSLSAEIHDGCITDNNVMILCPRLTKEAVTTMAFVTLRDNGERSFTFARKRGADMLLTIEDVSEEDLLSASIIHAGSCSLSAGSEADATIYALRHGSEQGNLISFDVNYRDMIWGGDTGAALVMIQKAMPYVNLLKISDEETALLGGNIPALMKNSIYR